MTTISTKEKLEMKKEKKQIIVEVPILEINIKVDQTINGE